MTRGTPRRSRPGTGKPAGWPKATVRRQGLTTPWLPRRSYEKLAKTEGSALYQARTEKIGLRGFLFRRGVPGVVSPACLCGRAFGYIIKEEVHRGLSHHDTASDMALPLVQSGWLPQFRVFNEL